MSPDLSIASKHTVGRRIAANTGLMMGSKALSALLGLGSILLATKYLDPASLGIILFVHAYMLFFSEVATFTSWQSIIRFGTDHVHKSEVGALSRLLQFAIKLDFVAAIAAFAAALGVFGLILWMQQMIPSMAGAQLAMPTETLRNYLYLYCILILFRQRGTAIGLFRLFDKFTVLAVQGLVMPVVRFAGVVTAAIMGAGFEGFLLAWFIGSLIAYIFFPIITILELRRRGLLKLVLRAKSSLARPGEGVWPFVVKSNLDSTLNAANLHLPTLLVMAVFGSTWVSIYRVAEELAKLLSEGFKVLDQVIYPELAKMMTLGDTDKIWRLVTKAALMLLTLGGVFSILLILFGPAMMSAILSEEYILAAPLTSLLVPAAAILGIAAPLYPVLYAADKPERAIYARGAGVFVYIVAFFGLSVTIGRMAPGWAAILGNSVSVIILVYLAKRTLDKRLNGTPADEVKTPAPRLALIGKSPQKLWGLPIREWQGRAYKKAGAVLTGGSHTVFVAVNWVLSSALAKAFVGRPQSALIVDGQIIGLNGVNADLAETLIGQSPEALHATNLIALKPEDLDDGYNKALRKTEPPYALDIDSTPVEDIMRRQFAASYKGITDFVTKWIWPVPAFHVTRACAALRLTPNMVTTVGLFLTIAAFYYFWQGQWFLGFFTGWLMTFLDTVDGKLARTTMTYSAWGNIYDHGIDLIHPPFWYIAWFVGLGGNFVWPSIQSDPMSLALVLIFAGYIIDRLVEGIFIVQHGFHIHVWKPINSSLRFFTARRNPNLFIFMIGIIASVVWPDAGRLGFYVVAIWTWVCISFNIATVIAGLFAPKPTKSWMSS